MIKDLRNLIFLYTNVDEYYLLRKAYKLSVKFYCRNVNTIPTENTQSYVSYQKELPRETSLLDWASRAGYLGVVKHLHKNGVISTEWTMGWASQYGHQHIVEYLYKIGYPNFDDAMRRACTSGNINMAKYLRTLDESSADDAICYACLSGHLELVKYLYESGARRPVNAFAYAAKHLHIVQYLQKMKIN